jgi:predicted metal-dependent phosphoesterase TrpH
MHVHTVYSHDGYLTLDALDAVAHRRGITSVAITDHDEIAGALHAADLHARGIIRTGIIVGEEIATSSGEIIGLFLRERIDPGMSMRETIHAIHRQGGLVYLNHPFGYSRRTCRLQIAALKDLWDHIDIVEIYNGRNIGQVPDKLAADLAASRSKPGGAGSDAHSGWEIGRTFVCIPPFQSPQEFLTALRRGRYVHRSCPVTYRLAFKMRKLLFRRPVPDAVAS